MIKVKFLQCNYVFVFTPSEFFHYLVGLCSAGRIPTLHISSTLNKSDDCIPLGDYSVIIEFRD